MISKLICKVPDPAVEAWASSHHPENPFFSAVGEAELRYGAAVLPTGRRRETPIPDIKRMLRDAFDGDAGRAYADIAAMHCSAGCPVAPTDCWITVIARSRYMAVATRNDRDFEDIDIKVVDP